MRTKLCLVPFYSFLFFPESVKETTCTNIMQILQKRDRSYDSSYCFLFDLFVSYLSLRIKSDSFLQDSIKYLDAQNC